MKMDIALQDHAPSPVDAAIYNVEIEKVSDVRVVDRVEGGACDVIDITWKIVGEGALPNGGETSGMDGRKVVDTYWILEKALWRVAIAVQNVMGLDRKALPQFESAEELQAFMAENMVGRNAKIEVIVESRNDREQNQVKKIWGA